MFVSVVVSLLFNLGSEKNGFSLPTLELSVAERMISFISIEHFDKRLVKQLTAVSHQIC